MECCVKPRILSRVVAGLAGVVLAIGLLGTVAPLAEAATKIQVTKVTSSKIYAVPGYAPGMKAIVTKPVLKKGATKKIRAIFNAKIDALVTKETKSLINEMAELSKQSSFSGQASLKIAADAVNVYKNRYVSVALYINRDNVVGASSCTDSFVTYTYDTKKGKFLSLSSFANTNHNQLFWEVIQKAIAKYPDSYPEYAPQMMAGGDINAGWVTSAKLPSTWTVSSNGVTFWSPAGGLGTYCYVGPTHFTIAWGKVLTPSGAKGSAKTYKKIKTWYHGDSVDKSTVKIKGKQIQLTDGWGDIFWGVRGAGKTARVYQTWKFTWTTDYGFTQTELHANVAIVTFSSKSVKAKPIKVVIEGN